MHNVLDREDRVLRKRALIQLNKWISEHLRQSKQPHPFVIVGENKGKENDRRQTQSQ
jgi:hypothetical protein